MAKGHLGNAYIGTSGTAVYTVPAGKVSIVNIHILNSNTSSVAADCGIEDDASTGSLTDGEHLIKEYNLAPGEFIQITGVMLSATDSVSAKSDTASSLEVNVWGYEEDA